MDHIIATFEIENTLDWLVEYIEQDGDDHISEDVAFDSDIEAWARHALACNGFGDY